MTLTSTLLAALPVGTGLAALYQRRCWLRSAHSYWLNLALLLHVLAWMLYSPILSQLLPGQTHTARKIASSLIILGVASLTCHLLDAIGALTYSERKRIYCTGLLAIGWSWFSYIKPLSNGPAGMPFDTSQHAAIGGQLALSACITYYAAIICQAALQVRRISHPHSTHRKVAYCYVGAGSAYALGSLVNLAVIIDPTGCVAALFKVDGINWVSAISIATLTALASHLNYREFARPLVIPDSVPTEWRYQAEGPNSAEGSNA